MEKRKCELIFALFCSFSKTSANSIFSRRKIWYTFRCRILDFGFVALNFSVLADFVHTVLIYFNQFSVLSRLIHIIRNQIIIGFIDVLVPYQSRRSISLIVSQQS